jgi:hypothetical protein
MKYLVSFGAVFLHLKLKDLVGGRLSRYSDGLRAGRPELYFRQGQEIFLYYTAPRLALLPT